MIRDEHTQEEIVERAGRALREAPVPEGPPPEVLAAVLAAGQRPGNQFQITTERKRRFMMKRILRIAAAVVVAAGATAIIAFTVRGTSTVAFAEVRRQIQEAQSMTCKITLTGFAMAKDKRLEAQFAFKEPGRMRQRFQTTTPDGQKLDIVQIFDFEQGKSLALMPEQKKAVTIDFGQLPEEMRDECRNYVAELKTMVEGSDKPLGEKEIDGAQVIGFEVTHRGQVMVIWADPQTGLPVLIEADLPGGMSMTMSEFVFNPELDEELFSLTPPEDYEVQEMEMPLGDVTEEDLLDGLRLLAECNDETFPDQPMPTPEIMKQMMKKYGKMFEEQGLSRQEAEEEGKKLGMKIARLTIFLQKDAATRETWHYAGKGVKLGDGDTAICWYRPKDSETYRVVYGDLTVQDVAPEYLPEKSE